MDDAFRALADPSRRRLLDRLNERNGQTLRELCDGLDEPRQAVSKHLPVLEAADLVTTVRRGREKLHYLNAAPINAIADRGSAATTGERAAALADLTTALERQPMESPTFVYTTYVPPRPSDCGRAHRTGVHPSLLGRSRAGLRLAGRVTGAVEDAPDGGRATSASGCSSPSRTAASPTAGTASTRARRALRLVRRGAGRAGSASAGRR